jgi:hypothetical protein
MMIKLLLYCLKADSPCEQPGTQHINRLGRQPRRLQQLRQNIDLNERRCAVLLC